MTDQELHRWPQIAQSSNSRGTLGRTAAELAALRQAARGEGYEQGFQEGLAAGQSQAAEQASARLAALEAALAETKASLAAAAERLKQALPEFYTSLLRRLLIDAAARSDGFLAGLAGEAATQFGVDGSDLEIAVASDWAEQGAPFSEHERSELPLGRIELCGGSGFARLDLDSLIQDRLNACD